MSGKCKPDRHLGCFVDLDFLFPQPLLLMEWGRQGKARQTRHMQTQVATMWVFLTGGRTGFKLAQLLFLPFFFEPPFFFLPQKKKGVSFWHVRRLGFPPKAKSVRSGVGTR